ncbi:hypothetical protein [Devosia sp.]|uniref:hypothetical protein n=1 Tax=Devosia sp. TaxID=1871048 RepID=UPI003A8DF185
MSVALLVIAGLVWLVAAYAFVRILTSWYRVFAAAPAGQGFETVWNFARFNFPVAEKRIGAAALRLVGIYRQSIAIFAACIGTLVAVTVVNIVIGKAA